MLVSLFVSSLALAPPGLGRREVMTRAAATCAAPALAAALAAPTVPMPALAESTLVTRQQAYTRYVPRIERGRDYWAVAVKKAIGAGDWATLTKALEKKGSIDRMFGPMELWASSFSGKTISPKTLGMNDAIADLKLAAADLRFAATGTEGGGGLFGFISGPKKLDESKRSALAKSAYASGVEAFNRYIEAGNDSLGLQLSPLDTID